MPGHTQNKAPYRFDVKISGGKVALDPPMGTEFGISVQDPVDVFSDPDHKPRKRLEQGDEEYFISSKAWFGSYDKARMFVTEYYVEENDGTE